MGSNKISELGTKRSTPSYLGSTLSHPLHIRPFFVFSRGNVLIYFLVYVDGLIIIGSNPSLVYNIIR